MKNFLALTIICFILNGCCLVTSQDCGCNVPDPEFLNEESKDWLRSFENGEFQIFEDDNGNLDSLEIEIVQDTYFIGGDECGSNGEIERAVLESINNGMNFSIEATRKNYIFTNYIFSREDFIQIELNLQNEKILVFNENTTGEILNDFNWNGESIQVLKVNCTSDCINYKMRKFIISKELGLLEFVDGESNTWKRIN